MRVERTYICPTPDGVQVKGKSEFVMVYEVFEADSSQVKEEKLATCQVFLGGLHQYMLGKFAESEKLFSECLRHSPLDNVAQLYLRRCQHLKERSLL